MDFRDYLKSLSQIDRELLAHSAGKAGSYVTSLMYRKDASPSLSFAVELDRMTNGEIDFRTCATRISDVDWKYVKDALNARM